MGHSKTFTGWAKYQTKSVIIPKLFHLYTFHSVKRRKKQLIDVKNEVLTKAVSYSDFQICNIPYDTTSQTNQHHEKAKFTDRGNPPNHDITTLDVAEEQLSPLLPGHLHEPLQGWHDSVTLCNKGTASYKRPNYTLTSQNNWRQQNSWQYNFFFFFLVLTGSLRTAYKNHQEKFKVCFKRYR